MTDKVQELAQRPTRITVIVVLTWLAGVLDIVAGIVFMAFSRSSTLLQAAGIDEVGALASGIVMLIVGVVTLAVAAMLSAGSNGARILVSVLMLVRVIAHVWGWLALGASAASESVMGILFAVIILTLLWTPRSNEFFGK